MSRVIERPRALRRPAAKARSKKVKALKATAAVKTARLEARINPELRAMLQQAAELEGRKMTEFVTSALQEAARRTISAAHVLKLSIADQEIFASALIDPPEAAPALKRAFARRRGLLAKR
jgi:uncharacterized protein (DUF1778 family)